jgi:hypothetical protein
VWGDVPQPPTVIGAGIYFLWREQKLGHEETVVNPSA